MRVHSDILTEESIRQALKNAQSNGRTGETVSFDVLTTHGSRKRKGAFEVQIASSTCASFKAAGIDEAGYSTGAVKRASRRHTRQWSSGSGNYAPTWHEWGHFISELFWLDPNAIVGAYDGQDSFEYQTDTGSRPYRHIDHAFDYNGRAYDFMEDVGAFHTVEAA